MRELYYSPFSLAYITDGVKLGLGAKGTMELLNWIYDNDSAYLLPEYRKDRKKFILDTLHWQDYLSDKVTLDNEFPAIQRDFDNLGLSLSDEIIVGDYPDVDLFFKVLRLRILFVGSQDYVRMRLRTLLTAYGYKRRTKGLMDYLRECMYFYHIQPYTKGNVECDIREINLDEMITFRVL
jgi:hypothetical protein